MSTVVFYCWCHSDNASVLLYFTLDDNFFTFRSAFDWETEWKVKADDLASIREDLVKVKDTMSTMETAVNTWRSRLDDIVQGKTTSLSNQVKLPPISGSGRLKFKPKPRQKLLEKVKKIDGGIHKKRSAILADSGGMIEVCGPIVRPLSEGNIVPASRDIVKDLGPCGFPDGQNDKKRKCKEGIDGVTHSPLHNKPKPDEKHVTFSTEDADDLKAEVSEKEKRDIDPQLVTPTCSTSKEKKKNVTPRSVRASGVNKEFQEMFRLLDVEFDKKKKLRESGENDSEKNSKHSSKVEKGRVHVPSRTSGLYKEFEELFRLLDNQKSYDSRLMQQSGIMADIDEICSFLDTGSPLVCHECRHENIDPFCSPELPFGNYPTADVESSSSVQTNNVENVSSQYTSDTAETSNNRSQSYTKRSKHRGNSSQSANPLSCRYRKTNEGDRLSSSRCSMVSSRCSFNEVEHDRGHLSVRIEVKERPLSVVSHHVDDLIRSASAVGTNGEGESVPTIRTPTGTPINTSLNAKKVRWSDAGSKAGGLCDISVFDKDGGIGGYTFPKEEHPSKTKFRRNQSIHGGDDKGSQSLNMHIKDVLLELPPITNDMMRKRVSAAANDLCGWAGRSPRDWSPDLGFQQLDNVLDERDPLYLRQKYGKRNQWSSRLPPLPKLSTSTKSQKSQQSSSAARRRGREGTKDEAMQGVSGVGVSAEQEEEKMWFQDESESTKDNDAQLKLNFIEFDELPPRKEPKRNFTALPPLKGTGIDKNRKESKEKPTEQSDKLDLKIQQSRDTDAEKRKPTPVKEFLKPLPPMKRKTSTQKVNWAKKNVGPIKVPPLDLNLLDGVGKDGINKGDSDFVADLVLCSPKEISGGTVGAHAPTDHVGTGYYIAVDERMPTDNMLKYHFRRTGDDQHKDKRGLPVHMLGKKVEFSKDYTAQLTKETDAFLKRKYRLQKKTSDVPMELVKIAVKANSLNKGYNNVSQVLQESKRCKSLFTSGGHDENCHRKGANPARKANKNKPRLQRLSQEVFNNQKAEDELNALRTRLRNTVRQEAADKVCGWYDKYDEYMDATDSVRSAIARPCSPNSNRTPR